MLKSRKTPKTYRTVSSKDKDLTTLPCMNFLETFHHKINFLSEGCDHSSHFWGEQKWILWSQNQTIIPTLRQTMKIKVWYSLMLRKLVYYGIHHFTLLVLKWKHFDFASSCNFLIYSWKTMCSFKPIQTWQFFSTAFAASTKM